ncbi:hypothetical protein DFH06DRAFT_1233665 [Mycena polygramma]|nr:hypothetical protein DFH06DRAFT_1233665 [Mycena polygramma]
MPLLPHPVLRLENLSKLPVAYHGIANAAADGSLNGLVEFVRLCKGLPQFQPILLPALFANLDPARIPSDSMLGGSLATSRIRSAFLSLDALVNGRETFNLPNVAYPDVWSRAWRWILFMDTHSDLLPAVIDQNVYGLYMASILVLQAPQETEDLLDTTRGVRVVVAHAWRVFLNLDTCLGEEGFSDVCRYMLLHLKTSDPEHLAEVIEGVGGTMEDLALTIVQHIRVMVASNFASATLGLRALITLLNETNGHAPLKELLLSAGIIKPLVSLICILAGTAGDDAATILRGCLGIMARISAAFEPPKCLPDALRSGLLRGICVSVATHPSQHDILRSIVQKVLPPTMIYHSVLSCMHAAVIDVGEWGTTARFKNSGLYKDWEMLMRLVKQRLLVAAKYDAGDYPSRMACNNTECTEIRDRREMKRCGACHRLNYCSVKCQSVHWNLGRHRDVCPSLRASRLREPEMMSRARDRAFMRALAHQDFRSCQQTALVRQLEFLRDCPRESYWLLFDYTTTHLQMEIHAITDTPRRYNAGPPNDFQVQWPDQVARANESGGRMLVAALRFLPDRTTRCVFISMHSPSSVVVDRLHDLAATIDPDVNFKAEFPAMAEKVRELIPLVNVVI